MFADVSEPAAAAAGGAPGGAAARAVQPRALIVTIYGLYARPAGGWLSVAALIRLMGGLGVDEPAVRSAISRLKQRGLLEPRRENGAAGYGLSALGRSILAEGDRRIFERPRAGSSDGWLLAVFSVPENERSRRHTLRSRLAWLGFGTVSAGVWIAPGQLAAETQDVLSSYGLAPYVSLFRAEYLAFGDVRELVSQWWDLARLEELYQAFIDSASPVLARWTGATAGPAATAAAEAAVAADGADVASAAFADYVRVLTAWRRLPFLDPGLPAELLPAGWHGTRAAELFDALRDALAAPAQEYVRTVTASPPRAPAPSAGQGMTA
jgi:phenylacetic acid degradation operon negative regulatory protein